ncbi:polymer-forming cytoskeletal protein [Methanosalsum natronophilum]|uniref:Polymer-forming cytoskeletal protein n=1 Tax=Methanosalsum natronophilum TaxID=768733 RepID=A0A3R7WET4_9EURY|nr:polymer-forming cytoskeletal protein [Methanosalsum natronophilum]MCS3923562.1 putative acyltransferase (DUF342 family) [Methanosalsum natronophilum]RQD86130.1 MAG: polymer-forming cytoskeletal protein [Methanosalsum natronophilum]
METENIKYHPPTNTYIVRRGSYFEDDIVIQGNLLTGSNVNFWGSLYVSGELEMGKCNNVKSSVIANSALVGPNCHVGENIEVNYDLLVLDNTIIENEATSYGNMKIRPGCSINYARSEGLLEIVGKAEIKKVESGTKVIVRTE